MLCYNSPISFYISINYKTCQGEVPDLHFNLFSVLLNFSKTYSKGHLPHCEMVIIVTDDYKSNEMFV